MGRRSRTQITKELALKVRDKLKAKNVSTAGDAHDEYAVYDEHGNLVATFGIRRGSRKGAGHDHIPGDLGVPTGFTKLLGQCPKSRADYLGIVAPEE